MAVFCSFDEPNFVRWLMSDGFVRQSKRALSVVRVHVTQYVNVYSENQFLIKNLAIIEGLESILYHGNSKFKLCSPKWEELLYRWTIS